MNYKSLLLGTILIFTLAGAAYAVVPHQIETAYTARIQADNTSAKQKLEHIEPEENEYEFEYEDSDEDEDEDDTEESKEDEDDTNSTPVVTPVSVISTPEPTPEPATTGYTLAEVEQHDTEASCWTAVDGNVYDLTPFIRKHPGGRANIMRICGIDGTAAFSDQHGGERRPENTLDDYYLGPLSN